MVNIDRFGSIIEKLFNATANVYQYTDVDQDDGTTESQLSAEPSIENVRCKLSFKEVEVPEDSVESALPPTSTIKLFFNSSHAILEGDFVAVTMDSGAHYSGQVGRPSSYGLHHREYYLFEKKDA